MNSLIEKNKAFTRAILSGKADRHGFICHPPIPQMFDDYTVSDKPVKEWVPFVVENYRRRVESLETLHDDSVPLASLLTGTHLFAKAFGCEVHSFKDSKPCALPLVNSADEADQLEVPDIWKTECLQRVFELGQLVLKELGTETPLGPCDLQSGFDTASLIWNKQDLLCSMALEPEAVKRLSAKCAQLLKTFLLAFRKEFPTLSPCHFPITWVPPELGPWLSNDECGIMSNDMFEDFCLPELIDLSETFGGLGMHCCADAEHQFPSFKKIPNFYGFNRVPAKHDYMTLLEHFSGKDSPVHFITHASDDVIAALIRQAPHGTRFVFNFYSSDKENDVRRLEIMRSVKAEGNA
jgi:hypothetical protein